MNVIKFSSPPQKNKEEHIRFRYLNIIKETDSLKFLSLELDKFLNWKNHIDKLLPRLGSACFAIRSVSCYCDITTIRMIYFAYFHSLLQYGIAFWWNSTERVTVFKLKERAIRLMTGSNVRTSCRPLFPMLGIMTVPCQYIFSLMRFLSRNLELYKFNSTVHNYNTRNRILLHKPSSLLTIYQKGLYYESVGIFNKLPHNIAELISHNKSFLTKLKKVSVRKSRLLNRWIYEWSLRQIKCDSILSLENS